MPVAACQNMTPEQVTNAFLAAPPQIASAILDFSVRFPRWLSNLAPMEAWPLGQGTIREQIIYRALMPQIERGFDTWKKLSNNTGCTPCEGPDCSYNWQLIGGNGLERRIIDLMEKDFTSENFCVKTIQTTFEYQQMFDLLVKNLWAQIEFYKEQNIMFNYLTGLAKKFVIDSEGIKGNRQNPYVYRPAGTAQLSTIGIQWMEILYEWMYRMPEVLPFTEADGNPQYAISCSKQLLSHLYRDNPTLTQDLRFSGYANALVDKYNITSTIRGMFIEVPLMYPRRFVLQTIGGVAGTPVEVLPLVNGIPMEVGSFSDLNPDYMNATHEEVLIYGRDPFKLYYMPSATTLGNNTSFGPEPQWFQDWVWFNPATESDPLRRNGKFLTTATIGLSPQYSQGIFGILVERPRNNMAAVFLPVASCPPVAPECTNTVPEVGCPCPIVVSAFPNPVTSGNFFLTLAVPTDAEAEDPLLFGLDNGGFVTTEVVTVSTDGTVVEVSVADASAAEFLANCDHFTTLYCLDTLACSAQVLKYNVNCTDNTRIDLLLSTPIKADAAAQVVTLYYGNGETASAQVVTANPITNQWVVDLGSTVFCDDVGGVYAVCVPTTTDATCPACGIGPVITPCEEE